MTLRDDLLPVVDDVRQMIDEALGLRLHTVQVVRRTWSGDEPGRGTPTDVPVSLEPTPRVRPPSSRLVATEGGVYESGDRIVDRISATYTEADLVGLAGASEVWWEIDGDPYRVQGVPEKRMLEWRVHLKRMRNRPSP